MVYNSSCNKPQQRSRCVEAHSMRFLSMYMYASDVRVVCCVMQAATKRNSALDVSKHKATTFMFYVTHAYSDVFNECCSCNKSQQRCRCVDIQRMQNTFMFMYTYTDGIILQKRCLVAEFCCNKSQQLPRYVQADRSCNA